MITQSQLTQLASGLDQTLTKIEGELISQVFGDSLPLLGDGLAAAAGAAPALHYATALNSALSSGFGTLTGSATYTEAQVEQALYLALNSAGIASGAGPQLDLTNPNDIKLVMNTGKSYAAFDVPLEANLGVPGLGIQSSGTAHNTFNYNLNFGVGLDAAGYYLNTDNTSVFQAGFNTTLTGLDVSANLSQLHFKLTDESATDGDSVAPTSFAGNFTIDLLDPGSLGADNKLRLGELTSGADLLNATLNANANINLNLASDLGTAVLPDIAADLNINWSFSNSTVDVAAGNVSFGNVPTVAFKNVSLGLGSFFDDFVTPVFGAVQTFTAPLQPIVDVLKTKIGFLSDLADKDVTLIDVAGGTGALSPETVARLDLYTSLISFINAVPSTGSTARIDLGDFSLGGQDPRAALFQLENVVPQSIRNAPAPGGDLASFLSAKNALPGGGLSFPIIENPTTVINLLFGKPVDFFTYHVPGLDINKQGFNEFYPIFGPFGVRLEATVEAHAYLDIGYDSTGIAQFAATGDPEDIFNGFYIVDQPGAEGTLTTNLQAFAAVNVVLAEMGVGGGITGNLNAFLTDSDSIPGDGRIHIAELANSCVFTVSGEVTAGLSAYLTVGFGPFSETFEENFGSEVLASFDVSSCDAAGMPGVPVLAHNTGSSVGLHIGADAALRQIGTLVDSAEDFGVVHISGVLGNEVIGVLGQGLLNEDGTPVKPQNYTVGANGRITANGGEKDDNLALAPDVLSPATLNGGVGNDRLIGGAGNDLLYGDAGFDLLVGGAGVDTLEGGADQDFLDGQEGDDILRGGGEADTLLGGAGADELNGGSGYDTATYISAPIGILLNLDVPGSGGGDAQGDTYISIERIVGSSHADLLFGTAGSENFGGGEGDDLLDGKQGDDLLSGDAGADQLVGGLGNDFAAYTLSLAGVNVSLFTGMGSGGDAQGDTLNGIENLQGSDYGDTLEGDLNANWLRGLNGNNILRGLGGNDLLVGGKDNDTLEGGDGVDTLQASLDVNSIDPQVSGGIDTLRGGTGNDFLYGDAGGDLLDGGEGADQIYGGKDNDTISGGLGDDLVYGGAGMDSIAGGDGQNVLYGNDGNDVLTAGSGDDQLFGGADNDTLNAGAGLNLLNGDSGNDGLTALDGNDTLNGGDGDDQLDAGEGSNVLNGDAGNDLLVSGAGADILHGGAGNDTASTGAGNDLVFGEDGNDSLNAGSGLDRVDGGSGNDLLEVGAMRSTIQDADRLDHLFGGAGFDTISADFSNQTTAVVVAAGLSQSVAFADGTEARDFENVHDLFTGSGADSLRLDGAADDGFANLLKTGAGNDIIYSGAGNDNVDAGDGDDFVNGGDTNVAFIYDGFGTIIGHVGGNADVLAGGPGNDTVSFDQLRKTVVYLGIGTDNGKIFPLGVSINLATNRTGISAEGIVISGFENIIGTNGADSLTGDDGPNIFQPLRGGGLTSGATGGPDYIDGAGGEDTLRIDFSLADLPELQGVYTNGSGFSRYSIGNTATGDTYSYYNIEHLQITGASKNDTLYPWFTGANSDILIGLGGNDTLGGGGGADTLLGGDGNDLLTAQGYFAVEYNGIAGGNDVLDGGAGDDLVEDIAFQYSSSILGADALFHLDGGSGFDTLSADFSNQVVPIVWSSAAPQNLEFADGAFARNFEALRYFATGSGNDVITQLGRVDNLFHLGAGNDTVNPGVGVDTVYGGEGFDVAILDFSIGDTAEMAGVQGYGAADGGTHFRPLVADFFNRPDNILLRGFERVQITGTSKNDTLAGTYGDDTIFGGDGNDILDGYFGGNNFLDGGNGDDVLKGSYGINGSGANDTMYGGAGNDTFTPMTGSDTIFGGSGNDIITATDYPSDGYGVDTFDAGDGDDVVANVYFNSGYTYTNAATRLRLEGGAGFDKLSADFGNQTQAIVFISGMSNSVEFADGSYFRNFEALGSFTSGSGDDTFILTGRADNNLSGGAGNDIINPGLGIEFASGGAGDDLLILDYSAGDDANVSGVTFNGAYLQRHDLSTNATLDSIYLTGFERYQETGGSKNDTLLGGSGDDLLSGNAGNDTLSGSGGTDILTGGTGADRFVGGAGDLNQDRITDFGLGDVIDVSYQRFSAVRYNTNTGVLELDTSANGSFATRVNLSTGLIGEFVATASATGQPASTLVQLMQDSDADGVGDFHDNAIFAVNPDQRDTDGDGYGNVADADLNQDMMVDFFDLSLLGGVYGSNDANADFNGDGAVDFYDLDILGGLFGAPPGPSYVDSVAVASAGPAEALAEQSFIAQVQSLESQPQLDMVL